MSIRRALLGALLAVVVAGLVPAPAPVPIVPWASAAPASDAWRLVLGVVSAQVGVQVKALPPQTITISTTARLLSACSNTGVCPGTPTWNTSANGPNVQACNYTIETNGVYWLSDTTSTATVPTAANSQSWPPGIYWLVGNANVRALRMIRDTADSDVRIQCYRA